MMKSIKFKNDFSYALSLILQKKINDEKILLIPQHVKMSDNILALKHNIYFYF